MMMLLSIVILCLASATCVKSIVVYHSIKDCGYLMVFNHANRILNAITFITMVAVGFEIRWLLYFHTEAISEFTSLLSAMIECGMLLILYLACVFIQELCLSELPALYKKGASDIAL